MYKEKSLGDELAEYVKKNLRKGYTVESLRWALISQGYSKFEVEKSLKKAEMDLGSEAPVLKVKPKIEVEVTPVVEEEPKKKGFWKSLFGDDEDEMKKEDSEKKLDEE